MGIKEIKDNVETQCFASLPFESLPGEEREQPTHWLDIDDLPQMAWMSDLEDNHPRKKIRIFLHRLFRLLGSELPLEWPQVSAGIFGECLRFLRNHLDPLYAYTESRKEYNVDNKLMPRYLGETAVYLLQVDWSCAEDLHRATPEFEDYISDRPQAIIDFDQLYCTPKTSERRAELIRQNFDHPSCRVLFLGDDDLVSLALAQNFSGQIDMIDLDDRLHEYIALKAPNVRRHRADFILDGISRDLYQVFDAVVLDPPWDSYRMWCFLDKAIYCLKDHLNARIFMSFCPLLLEHRQRKMDKFYKRLAKLGFTFESIAPAFNLYDLSPLHLPDFQKRLDKYLPDLESPLLQFLRQLPFAHSHIYTIRRIAHFRRNWLAQHWFRWWNTSSKQPSKA